MLEILSLNEERNIQVVEEAAMQAKEEKEFTLQERRCLIVWVYTLKPLKQLRRYGLIHYVSRKMKYVVIYMNEENIESNMEKINQLHFVRSVDKSYRPDVEMNFAEKLVPKRLIKNKKTTAM